MISRLGPIGWIIVFCVMATIVASAHEEIMSYAMHDVFIREYLWSDVFLQFLLYQFLHGGVLHLFSNVFFLVLIGLGVQYSMSTKRFLGLFAFTTVFVGVALILTTDRPTIGMSGFAMALLTFYTLMLWSVHDEQYKSGIVLILINLMIGLDPSISLMGHLLGSIAGLLYWLLDKRSRKQISVFRLTGRS